MWRMGRFLTLLLLTWSMCAAALPGEDNFSAQTSREQSQKSLLLKMLAGLLNGVDADGDGAAVADFEEPPERKVEGQPWPLGPRDRKTPCKNFFWKTFTAC